MARQRKKGSKVPYLGLGLKPEEEERLQKLIEQEEIGSGRRLLKALVRDWMGYIMEGGSGIPRKYRMK